MRCRRFTGLWAWACLPVCLGAVAILDVEITERCRTHEKTHEEKNKRAPFLVDPMMRKTCENIILGYTGALHLFEFSRIMGEIRLPAGPRPQPPRLAAYHSPASCSHLNMQNACTFLFKQHAAFDTRVGTAILDLVCCPGIGQVSVVAVEWLLQVHCHAP